MSKIKSIKIGIASILLISLLLSLTGCVGGSGEIVSLFGVSVYKVSSDSMRGAPEGYLGRGSIIFVKDVAFDELQVGDVVVFRDRDFYITHRLKEYRPDFEYVENNETLYGGWVTGGDYMSADDPNILVENSYIGKVVGGIPGFGGNN